jgi:hypothetical protein
VDTADEVGLLGSVIDTKADTDVDTVAKLQQLADAVQNVMDGDASKADLERLGITGVTDENLKAVQDKLAATADGDLKTQADLQAAVTAAVEKYDTATAKIAEYADAGTAAPTVSDYEDAGVTGVSSNELDAINSAIKAQAGPNGTQANGDDKEAADQRTEIKAIVNALRQGDLLYLLPDMNFRLEESIFVPFYGVPAATVTTLPRLSRLGQVPVVPVTTRLTASGYEVQVHPAWTDYPTDDVQADTTMMNQCLQTWIDTMPTQYYWVHKRFKSRPNDEASLYPPGTD